MCYHPLNYTQYWMEWAQPKKQTLSAKNSMLKDPHSSNRLMPFIKVVLLKKKNFLNIWTVPLNLTVGKNNF